MLKLKASSKPIYFFTEGALYIWYPGGRVEGNFGSDFSKYYRFISRYKSPLDFKKKVLYGRVIDIGV